MSEFVVIETDLKTGKHVRLHLLSLPKYNEAGWYQQTVSFNAFFRGGNGRNKRRDEVQYVAKSDVEFKSDKKIWGIHVRIPKISHEDIWCFYKSIGYNHKSKRYT